MELMVEIKVKMVLGVFCKVKVVLVVFFKVKVELQEGLILMLFKMFNISLGINSGILIMFKLIRILDFLNCFKIIYF